MKHERATIYLEAFKRVDPKEFWSKEKEMYCFLLFFGVCVYIYIYIYIWWRTLTKLTNVITLQYIFQVSMLYTLRLHSTVRIVKV